MLKKQNNDNTFEMRSKVGWLSTKSICDQLIPSAV